MTVDEITTKLTLWASIRHQAEANEDADGWLEAVEESDRLLDLWPRS